MTAKVLCLIAAVALLLSGLHVTVPAGACVVTVPLPVFALLAELGVVAVLCWLICRAAGYGLRFAAWRTA